jgi:hypothetical protein
MNKNLKLWLILAAVLVAAGLLMMFVAMSAYHWDFTQLNTVPFETNTYTLSEAFHSLTLDTSAADISIVPSASSKCQVVCSEPENLRHSVAVLDGTLTIQEIDTRKWNQYIGFSFGSSQITVYLPQAEYQTLYIRESTGDVEIAEDFSFQNIDIKVSTGDITNYASASNITKIQTSTGYIRVEGVSTSTLELVVSTGNATVVDTQCNTLVSRGSTGDLILKNVTAIDTFRIERSSGDVTFEVSNADQIYVETDAGDVTFDTSDAGQIYLETDTGDVRGSLQSPKVFLIETDTGDIDVPKSTSGGLCEISTDTGDIEITVLNTAS